MSLRKGLDGKGLMQGIFFRFGFFVCRHPKKIIAVASIITLASIMTAALTLELDADILSMMPQKDRQVRLFREHLEVFGTSESLTAILTKASDVPVDRLTAFADSLAGELEESGLFHQIRYGVSQKQREFFLDFFKKKGLLYLTEDQLREYEKNLTRDAIRDSVKKTRLLLISQAGAAAGELISMDPAGVFEPMMSYLQPLAAGDSTFQFSMETGLYLAPDGNALFMLMEPKKPPQDIDYSRNLKITLDNAVESVREEGYSGGELQCRFAGVHLSALADAETIRHDIQWTFITSFLGVLLLYLFFFRHVKSLLIIGASLLTGIIWSVGLLALLLGKITLVTGVFAAVLVGLGIDFAIHIMNRFREEKSYGRQTDESMATALSESGPGVFTGALTTAAVFGVISLSRFHGLAQMGISVSVGLVLTLLSLFTFMPALLYLTDKRAKTKITHVSPVIAGCVRKYAAFFLKNPVITSVTGIIAAVAGAIFLFPFNDEPILHFETNLAELRSQKDDIEQIQKLIEKHFGGSESTVIAIHEADTAEKAFSQAGKTAEIIEKKWDAALTDYDSITTFIPKRQAQRKRQQLITERIEPQSAVLNIRNALSAEGFRLDKFEPYLEAVQEFLAPEKLIDIHDFLGSELSDLLKIYYMKKEGSHRFFTYIRIPHEKWESDSIREALKLLERESEAVLTGMDLLISKFKNIILEDLNRLVVLAVLLTLLILRIHFGNVKTALLCLTPLIYSLIWSLALMKYADWKLNFMNIIVVPVIIGIGVDDGVHILHRYRSGKKESPETVVEKTGVAVLLTSLTTMIGFGSLILAQFKGLATIGRLALLGIGFCLISALTFLPPLMKIFLNNAGKKEETE